MSETCDCLVHGPKYATCDTENVGITKQYGEVSIRTCQHCGRRWLRYVWEHEAFSRSQKIYIGFLGNLPTPKPDDAVPLLQTLQPRFFWPSDGTGWHPHHSEISATI